MSNLPSFLVIGAMKCATTTLHQDLVKHPDIFCGVKELNALTCKSADGNEAAKMYQHNYRNARGDQILGDVSTHYSMLPDYPGVAKIAAKLIGSDLKIIYLVREPIRRCLSHHQHMMNESTDQKMGPDVNFEIQNNPSPIAYSRYAMQLEPWVSEFGIDQVKVIKFEEYVADRVNVVAEIFQFLNAKPLKIEVDPAGANRGHSRLVAGTLATRLWHSKVFQRILKPFSPSFVRKAGRRILLKKAAQASVPPTAATIDLIFENVKQDAEKLQKMTGRSTPYWDLEMSKSNFISQLKRPSD